MPRTSHCSLQFAKSSRAPAHWFSPAWLRLPFMQLNAVSYCLEQLAFDAFVLFHPHSISTRAKRESYLHIVDTLQEVGHLSLGPLRVACTTSGCLTHLSELSHLTAAKLSVFVPVNQRLEPESNRHAIRLVFSTSRVESARHGTHICILTFRPSKVPAFFYSLFLY